MRRRLPDLVGLFADFQRRRAGALELDLFLLLMCHLSGVRLVHFCRRFVWDFGEGKRKQRCTWLFEMMGRYVKGEG
jgi:hypothetical protein